MQYNNSTNPVRKRVVYYLSGFDPRGVRLYHSIYKKHAHEQSKINGIEMQISSRKKIHNHLFEWDIKANDNGVKVETTYKFLSWDDIIRHEWSSGLFSYYKDLLYFFIVYIFNGLFVTYIKASPKQIIAAFYPALYLLLALFLALYAGSKFYFWWNNWLAIIPSFTLAFLILYLFEKIGEKIGVFWLLRIYAFSARWGRDEITAIEERIDIFAKELALTLEKEDADEVLLVSHSVGTILAVSVVARALEQTEKWSKFGMVTLGECIPLVSFQPDAHSYRKELQAIANREDIYWLDYTAPIDGACFPLHDFMKSSSITPKKADIPIYLSPRFHKLFDKLHYKKLRRDWYTTHFLYLMSTDKLGEYDYFALTAGSQRLRSKIQIQKSL